MRTTRLALAFLLVAACGDDGNKANDGGGGDDGGGSGSDDGSMVECVPPPLPACAAPINGTNVVFEQVGANGAFENGTNGGSGGPILVTSPPNDPRQFVAVRNGRIRVIENGALLPDPFFDLDQAVNNLAASTNTGEQGLLGLVFHPQYKCNGEFFIFYTTANADIIARCTVSATNPNQANPTCTTMLSIPDFASNHNGGMMEFGEDGFLYIGTGDGGSGGDPRRNGQSLTDGQITTNSVALLGKMLRLDVDHKDPGKEYAIPPSNPFAAGGGAPEIWMYGLRNPWRWSFDRGTGDLWIGDVGQIKTEELTVVKAGEQSGKNLGWSIWEANRCCATLGQNDGLGDPDASPNGCEQQGTQQTCDMSAPGLVFPQDTHVHPTWISVIGGTTYRGTCMPDLVGWHFYTDFNSTAAGLHRARLNGNAFEKFDYAPNPPGMPNNITSMHSDANGEIYATTLNGNLFHIKAAP